MGIESIIIKEFTFRNGLDERGREIANLIDSVNAVCLNVRRTDFVSNQVANRFHGVCEMDYFTRAVKMMASKVNNPHFFVFSDDLEWCRANMHFDYPFTFIGNESAGFKFGQKLHLMTICKHFIIPNSSFGWWAAWLNPDPNKVVIAPNQWYRNRRIDTTNLLPIGWIRI